MEISRAQHVLVRSKSGKIVAYTLTRFAVSSECEKRLAQKGSPCDLRLPDFTVSFEGNVFYRKGPGILEVPPYRENSERKRVPYEVNGFVSQLITSEDSLDGRIDVSEIERTARRPILGE